MTWLRGRALLLTGILCLGGQGILLYVASRAAEAPLLPWPGLFAALAVTAMTCTGLGFRHPASAVPRRERRVWQGLAMATLATLLSVGLANLWLSDRTADDTSDHSRDLEDTVAWLSELEPTLQQWWGEAQPLLPGITAIAEDRSLSGRGGDLFRRVSALPRLWRQGGPGVGMGVAVWEDGTRLAWAGEIEPLAGLAPTAAVPRAPEWRRALLAGRAGWILRLEAQLDDRLQIEVQLPLTRDVGDEIVPGVQMVVGSIDDPALTMDDSGLLIRQVGLGPDQGGPFVHLLARPDSVAARRGEIKARWLLVALLAWTLALLAMTRLSAGGGVSVVALWIGRGILAGSDALRWLGVAFPDQAFPAPPGAWPSLVDPAYFATPFAGGWFASTADALLTALVLAVTVWYFLRHQQLLGAEEGAAARAGLIDRVPVWAGPILFGLGTGVTLWALRFLDRLVAENANPRLIGTGVTPEAMSFWGLQIVLMVMALALVALTTGLLAFRSWPSRGSVRSWLLRGVAAGVPALAVQILAEESAWWPARLMAPLVTILLWFVAPALWARPRFLRRFGWPLLMMLAVAWNYVSLREVYDGAEQSWLEAKGDQITVANPAWMRLLLGSVLVDMVQAEQDLPPQNSFGSLWADERAWHVFRASALNDLGYSCAVELLDPEWASQGFFATGFLNTPSFEVISRSGWVDQAGLEAKPGADMIFNTERRRYAGGEEEVMAAEAKRAGDRGWVRVEVPLRSWRVATLLDALVGDAGRSLGRYRPRAEVDRPVLLLLADDRGWLDSGTAGLPSIDSDPAIADLRSGVRNWADLEVDGSRWLCLWRPLPAEAARTSGEGFLLGLRRSGWRENVLDLSRLMLLNLVLFFLLFIAIQGWRAVRGEPWPLDTGWRPGFQEKFLAGYLALGLVLLLLVGMTIDRVGYERVRSEARYQTGAGLSRAVEQLRALLTEQARSLVDSEYIDDLMRGRLAGQRPVGSTAYRQGMVFGADGELLLDETLSDLSPAESSELLATARRSPMVVIRDHGELYIGTVIPINLGDWIAAAPDSVVAMGHSADARRGLFFYRQKLDAALVASLAELVGGQLIVDWAGQPFLASHPAQVFAGQVPLLANPDKMIPVLDHLQGASVFAAPGRPFAYTAGRPLAALARTSAGILAPARQPAVLNLAFPDRERDYADQRQQTVLFLAGLANLILLTALGLALLMSWHIFRPVRLLLTATRSLAQGDYEAPLPEPGRDEIGRLAGSFGAMRAELQTARDELAAREQFLASVLSQVTVGVAVIDDQERVVVLNPAGETILREFRPRGEVHASLVELLRDLKASGSGRERVAGELVSADRRRTVRAAMSPLDVPGDRVDTMLVFEDLTEFLATKKMAINAELARQVAHEIKNPLTPIQLSVQLLRQAWRDRHPQLDRMVPETIDRVLQQVELLRSIASEFSLLGRPGELAVEPLDLPALVKDVTGAYAGGSRHSVVMGRSTVPLVMADADSLRKILANLMQNSLDAARPDVELRIELEWREAADSVTLIWRDDGIGLQAEVADRLFDPYFSTKSKGTGLGLVICRNLVDRMGGTITLANRSDGGGAIAELTLPRADQG